MKLCFNKFYLFAAGLTMLLVGSFITFAPNGSNEHGYST